MKRIIDKKTGETFITELWVVEVKDGKRELKVELKTEDDVNRYYLEDVPEEKKYGGRVPKEGDEYFHIPSDGVIRRSSWNCYCIDKDRFATGSAFWTIEEAEKELARRKAYVILKEDTKGFEPDWKNSKQIKWYVTYDYWAKDFYINFLDTCIFTGIFTCNHFFASEQDAEASIKAHKKEWKTLFGV